MTVVAKSVILDTFPGLSSGFVILKIFALTSMTNTENPEMLKIT